MIKNSRVPLGLQKKSRAYGDSISQSHCPLAQARWVILNSSQGRTEGYLIWGVLCSSKAGTLDSMRTGSPRQRPWSFLSACSLVHRTAHVSATSSPGDSGDTRSSASKQPGTGCKERGRPASFQTQGHRQNGNGGGWSQNAASAGRPHGGKCRKGCPARAKLTQSGPQR